MATYGAKYYGIYDLPDGGSVRVYIQEKGYSGSTYRIAHMTGLSLEVGGGSDPVYTPIVKTTLRFSMRDVFDVGNSSAITPDGDKHGRWEEFYTNDATKYKVLLYFLPVDAAAPSRPELIWSGFITPDNWQEDLYYRGNINITARDMLGSLSDVEFDDAGTNGRITVKTLIEHAITKSEATMGVVFPTAYDSYFLRHATSGLSILNSSISVEAFKGKTWWNALSDTLEGLGLALRYNGQNSFVVASLRYLPDILVNEQHGCAFINHSGVRQLDPPVRDISGDFRADIESKAITPLNSSDLVSFGNVSVIYYDDTEGRIPGYNQGTAGAYELQQRSGDWAAGAGSASRPPLFVPRLPAFDSRIAISEHPYFICNTGQKLFIGVQKNYGIAKVASGVLTAPCKLIIEQAGDIARIFGTTPSFTLPLGENPALEEVLVYIKDSDGKYYQGGGSWVTGTEKSSDHDTTSGALDPLKLTFEGGSASLDIFPPSTSPNRMDIEVNIVYVGVDKYSWSIDPSLYVPLRVSMGENSSSDLADEYSVKTVYNEDYNVRISRTPALGSINTQLPGRLFNNVLLDTNGNPLSNGWEFAGMGGATGGYPLEVMVQAQLLQLYAASMSILTGSFHDESYDWAVPGTGYLYFGRPCLLMRGTFDFVTGYVRDAALREYLTWSEVWGSTFNPQYTENDERTGGSGGSGGGGSYPSGGGGASGSNVSWGGNAQNNYEKLIVDGDQNHTVALSGHGHSISDVSGLQNSLDGINAKIPSAASAQNQLVDRNTLNSSIATATASFRGTSPGGLTEAEFLEWADEQTHDLNDYCYWLTSDAAGNTLYKRYKYNGTQWAFEYALNNSSFTSDQWAAINSGITASLKNKVANPATVIDSQSAGSTDLVTEGAVYAALQGKQDSLTFDDTPTQNSNNPVKSGGVFSALAGKQDSLNFDDTPTANSNNPVKSGGIKTALDGKQDTILDANGRLPRSLVPSASDTYDLGELVSGTMRRWRYGFIKRIYLSDSIYLEADSNGKVHLYGAPSLVIENGDIASAGAPQS